jgi:hypothetical protein
MARDGRFEAAVGGYRAPEDKAVGCSRKRPSELALSQIRPACTTLILLFAVAEK